MNDEIFDILDQVCKALDEIGAVYAVTGSIASSVHGLPVSSNDGDICLRMSMKQAEELKKRVASRLYCDEVALREAARDSSMTNLIDMRTQFKVDLSFLKRDPFFDSVLCRRVQVKLGDPGPVVWMVTPEDIILMKLLWRKETRSQKQWDNALSVARVKGARLDWEYLREWANELGLREDLKRLMTEAGI